MVSGHHPGQNRPRPSSTITLLPRVSCQQNRTLCASESGRCALQHSLVCHAHQPSAPLRSPREFCRGDTPRSSVPLAQALGLRRIRLLGIRVGPFLEPRLHPGGHPRVAGWGHRLTSKVSPHLCYSGGPTAPLDWHLGVSNCSHACGCAAGYPRGFDPLSLKPTGRCVPWLVRTSSCEASARLRPSLLITLFIFHR